MNLNDLANLGQIVGAIAVVASLFYVAYQIRQNTNAVRSATAQAVHEHFASWYHLLAADAELSQIVVNGLRDYASLSERDKARFIAMFMAFSPTHRMRFSNGGKKCSSRRCGWAGSF
jgi:hypothetical protein